MPNWCMNSLTLSGPKDVLDEIAETKLTLKSLVPWPKELEGFEKVYPVPKNELKARAALEAKYGVSTLFDWCVKNWGTKWDIPEQACDVDEFSNPNGNEPLYEIRASFDTAWAPPVEAMRAVYDATRIVDSTSGWSTWSQGLGSSVS